MITFQKLWRKAPRTPNLQSALWGAGYVIAGSLLTGRAVGRQVVVSRYWEQWGIRMAQGPGSTSTKVSKNPLPLYAINP